MLLRPGLFARVNATIGMQKNALVVPITAVITVQNLNQLAVVSPDNKVTIQNVTIGESTREEAVVLSGVKAGDKIVVQGIQKVTDGCSVMPLPASGPAPAVAPASTTESKAPVATPSPAK